MLENCNVLNFYQFNFTVYQVFNGKLEMTIGFGISAFFCLFGGNKRVFIGGIF